MTYTTEHDLDAWLAKVLYDGYVFEGSGNHEMGAIRAARRKMRKYRRYAPELRPR